MRPLPQGSAGNMFGTIMESHPNPNNFLDLVALVREIGQTWAVRYNVSPQIVLCHEEFVRPMILSRVRQ